MTYLTINQLDSLSLSSLHSISRFFSPSVFLEWPGPKPAQFIEQGIFIVVQLAGRRDHGPARFQMSEEGG